jgi:hypothetical protein
LQEIAKNDINDPIGIDLNNFKVELSDFKQGSAVPVFKFTPRVHSTLGGDVSGQRTIVNDRFMRILNAIGEGDGDKIKEMYPSPVVRNSIVDKYARFSSSTNNSPMSLSPIDKKEANKIQEVKPLSQSLKKKLTTKIQGQKPEVSERVVYGTIKLSSRGGTERAKVLEHYDGETISLSYSPSVIEVHGRTYHFKYPLISRFYWEEGEDEKYYIVENEMFDIVGTGLTEEAAKQSFCEEFDYIYQRYNELSDTELSERLINIKNQLHLIVKT